MGPTNEKLNKLEASPLPALAATVLVIAALAIACDRSPTPRPARIILFSMDTVRADHVSGFADVDTAPALRDIAAQGVLFRRFYAAASYTLPSHMSMFTGLDVSEHGVVDQSRKLARGVPTLAKLLRDAGYRTAGFHEGGLMRPEYGFRRGFDSYQAVARGGAVVEAELPRILSWMKKRGDEPYFLFLHTYAAHFPYRGFARYRAEHPERGLPSDEEIEKLRRDYAAERWLKNTRAAESIPMEVRLRCTLYNYLAEPEGLIRCGDKGKSPLIPTSPHGAEDVAAIARAYDHRIGVIDHAIGEIQKDLTARGQWEDTLLIVTSDHGDAFWEHGLHGHEYVPFDSVLRVPLIVSYPRVLARGRVIDGLAWHLDLLPTILRLVGISPPEGLRGMDLTPVMSGRSSIPPDRAVFPAVLALRPDDGQPRRRTIVRSELKFVEGHERFGDPDGLLFDVLSDPGERRNLRRDRSAETAQLAALEDSYGRDVQASARPAEARRKLSEKQQEELRALGYVN